MPVPLLDREFPKPRQIFTFPAHLETMKEFTKERVFFDKASGYGRFPPTANIAALDGPCIEPYCAIWTGNSIFSIGAFSYSFSSFPPHTIQIGRYCSIAAQAVVMGTSHDYNLVSTSACLYEKGVNFVKSAFDDRSLPDPRYFANPQPEWPVVKNDVWIGQQTIIGRNLTLGDGCIVAAGAVVTKDVPAYAIVAGVPARVIKMRFSDAIIEKLNASRWWQYHYADICHLGLNDPALFLSKLDDAVQSGSIKPWLPDLINPRDIVQKTTNSLPL